MAKEMKYIFCDESRQDLLASKESISENNKYTTIGGIMIPAGKLTEIKTRMLELREKYNAYGELKWGTVTPSKINFYIEAINIFFEDDDMSFWTIVIDSSKIDNETFNKSDQELGYYKFYYELLYHWMDFDTDYRIYTDQKTNCDASRLKELRRIINTSFHGLAPALSIQAINSKESIMLQLENILMGAVGYKFNYCENGKSQSKNEVVKKIEENLGHAISSTSRSEKKFNVFKINLQEGR